MYYSAWRRSSRKQSLIHSQSVSTKIAMGVCCSLLQQLLYWGSSSSSSQRTPSSEMTEIRGRSRSKSLSIARAMTAPTIDVQEDGTTVSGHGLALVGIPVEQDAAYWEAHVEVVVQGEQQQESPLQEAFFGVSTKKDQKFYRVMEEEQHEDDASLQTALMRKIQVSHGDVVGIAAQHSDLPMVQLFLNGEPLHDLAINRFRGTVYPAVYLPETTNNDMLSIRLVFAESAFLQVSPHARFGPVIVARGII